VRRPAIRYCTFLEDTVDGPRCVAEIAAEVAARRLGLTHRVTEIGGKVVSIEDVTFAGRRVGDAERTDLVRGDDGAVREVIVRDRHENIERWEKWFEGGKRVDLVDDDGAAPRPLRETSITTIRRELDANGRFTSERYFAAAGRPACDEHKAYGYAYGSDAPSVGRSARRSSAQTAHPRPSREASRSSRRPTTGLLEGRTCAISISTENPSPSTASFTITAGGATPAKRSRASSSASATRRL
jgi:hypothetical protein